MNANSNLQDSAHPTSALAGERTAAADGFQLTAPASPSGAELILPETKIMEAAAAQSAEIAAGFIRQGNRNAARAHLHRALEQLNEAEIED